MEQTQTDIEQANQQLTKAEEYKKALDKKKICLIVTVIIIIIIIAIIIWSAVK